MPIWMEFMSKALPLYPNDDFAIPDKEEVTKYVYPPTQSDAPSNGQPGTAAGFAARRTRPQSAVTATRS